MDHGDKCVAFGPVVSVVPDKLDSFDFSEGTKFFSDGSFVGSERHAEDADDFGGGFVFGVFRGEGGLEIELKSEFIQFKLFERI